MGTSGGPPRDTEGADLHGRESVSRSPCEFREEMGHDWATGDEPQLIRLFESKRGAVVWLGPRLRKLHLLFGAYGQLGHEWCRGSIWWPRSFFQANRSYPKVAVAIWAHVRYTVNRWRHQMAGTTSPRSPSACCTSPPARHGPARRTSAAHIPSRRTGRR